MLLWSLIKNSNALLKSKRLRGANLPKMCDVIRFHESNLAVHVKGSIEKGSTELFYKQTLLNAKNSILESGISRFDVLRSIDQNDFLLIEVYNTQAGPDEHKKTEHYNQWREVVAPFMAKPRLATKFKTIFPSKLEWKTDKAASNINISDYQIKYPWLPVHDIKPFPQSGMLTVIVDVNVIPGTEVQFIDASLHNCRNSLKEVLYMYNSLM